MHRAIAAWLTGNPWRALLACAACGLVSAFLPFLIVSCAIPALLVYQGQTGFAIAAALIASLGWILLPTDAPGLWIPVGLALFFGPMLLAMLARKSGSLNLSFQIAVLTCGLGVVAPHVLLADPVQWWIDLMDSAMQRFQAAGVEVQSDFAAIVEDYATSMWGLLAAMGLAVVLGSLFLGRWWASLVSAPGAFGQEFRALRVGLVLGALIAAAVIAALTTRSPLASSLAWVGFAALVFQGLAAAHRRKALGQMSGRWLVLIYVFLIALPLSSLTCIVLATWGFVDNWLRPQARNAV